MAKKIISLGSKVAHRYARTEPADMCGESMLAETQALPRVLDPSRAVLVGIRLQVRPSVSSAWHSQPAEFSEAEVWMLFYCGFHHPGDPANSTFMMRKTDRTTGFLQIDTDKNSPAGSLDSVGPRPAPPSPAQPGTAWCSLG